EDELTIRYQVQEMLRIERIFEDAGIQDELDAYNPLIPDGSNWKATMLIEYPEEAERRRMLGLLRGIEQRVWAQVAASERVYAIADEDLERENDEKTSSVHFLRFELAAPMRAALARGAGLSLSVGADRIVRFTLVARSPSGVDNVSYEGMRCPREHRLYAVARAGGSWSSRDSDWREFARGTSLGWQYALAHHFFCPHRDPIRSAAEGVDALRRGSHPSVYVEPKNLGGGN